jgi:hypothetical protein
MQNVTPPSLDLATAAVKFVLIAAQAHIYVGLKGRLARNGFRAAAALAAVVSAVGLGLLLVSELFEIDELFAAPDSLPVLVGMAGSVYAAGCFGAYLLWWCFELLRRFRGRDGRPDGIESPGRRRALSTVADAALAAPFVVAGYGAFIGRTDLQVHETDILIKYLPADLEGLRITQLTDIHAGFYLSPRELERIVAVANETKPHIAVITGDLITVPEDPLDETIKALGGLRADAGVFGCMGNHEHYAGAKRYVEQMSLRREDAKYLRHRSETLRFGDARLALSGVD